jgi:hypothetical protein
MSSEVRAGVGKLSQGSKLVCPVSILVLPELHSFSGQGKKRNEKYFVVFENYMKIKFQSP